MQDRCVLTPMKLTLHFQVLAELAAVELRLSSSWWSLHDDRYELCHLAPTFWAHILLALQVLRLTAKSG